MVRHERSQSGQPARRRRRRLTVALGSAVLLVTGLLQPLGLLGSAHADDHITGPLQDAINRQAQSVQDSLAAAQAAVAAVAANAQAFTTQLTTIAQGAPTDPGGAAAALQAALGTELTSLETTGLQQALTLASRVAAPTCSTLGTLTALLPDAGDTVLPYSIFGPLANTVQQLDQGVSNALLSFYTDAFTKLLTPITLPPTAGALAPYVTLAQTLVSLLKVTWHTTYYPPGGGAPIVRDTQGLLNLPVLIDADGRTGEDVCGIMGLDLTTGKVTQTVARLPLAPGNVPLDIQAQFLGGLVTPGYETKTSKAPALFDTVITSSKKTTTAAAATVVDNRFLKPGSTFNQTINLAGLLQLGLNSTTPPGNYHYVSTTPGGPSGDGTLTTYTANAAGGSFAVNTGIAATIAGSPINLSTTLAQTPAATSFEHCTSAKGFCSNEPSTASATETASYHVLANRAVRLDQTGSCTPAGGICGLVAGALTEAHLTGSKFYLGHQPAADATSTGHVWVDTGNTAVNGTMVTGTFTGTLPTGFAANTRSASWTGTATIPPVAAKSGTVNCPAGTDLKRGAFGLSRYFCSFPPALVSGSAPSISVQNPGSAPATFTVVSGSDPTYEKVTLFGNNGDWTPPAPNFPTFTQTWQRCNATLPTLCTTIATGPSYTPTAADDGSRLKFVVKATNADSPAGITAASPLTAPVLALPAPVNIKVPLIQNGANSGANLTVLQGDNLRALNDATYWHNADAFSGGSFTYQWYDCDSAGNNCTPISNATSATYQAAAGDVHQTLEVWVTATNAGGFAVTAKSAPTAPVAPSSLLPALPNLNAVPDGKVYASAPSGQGDYIGGDFDTIGPRVGGAGALPGTPTVASKTPSLAALVSGGAGQVNAVVSDTAGGYFIGGNFDHVLGVACPGLAHITSTGALDTSTYKCRTGLTGEVRALTYVKRAATNSLSALEVLAVGGSFTDGGATNVMFLDPAGNVSFPANEPDGAVNALGTDAALLSNANFFIGGAFTHLGSAPSKRLGMVSMTAAQSANGLSLVSSNYPGGVDCTTSACTTPVVNTLSVMAHTSLSSPFFFPQIIFGGSFDTVYTTDASGMSFTGATPRSNAAAISEVLPGTQLVGGWNPSPNGPVTAITGVSSLLSNNATVYLAGDFTTVTNPSGGGKTAVNGLVEYGITTTTTGSPAVRTNTANPAGAGTTATSSPNPAWLPSIGGGQVLSILPGDGGVYLGGSFTSVGTAVRHRLAHVSAPGGTAAASLNSWDPNAGRTVRSLVRFAPSSGTPSIFVGGDYLVLGGTTRNHVAELTPGTTTTPATLTTWNPAGTAGTVRSLAATASTVYVGAEGTGSTPNLLAFKTSDGSTVFSDTADGTVRSLAVGTGTVYVGGDFTHVGSTARSHLAAVDDATGALSAAWNAAVSGGSGATVNAIVADAAGVYVGGTFTQSGSATRSNLAAFDPTNGALSTTWAPGAGGPVYALGLTNTQVYVGGSSIVGSNNAAAYNRSDGSPTGTAWNPPAAGAIRTLVVQGSKVLVGGDFGAEQVDAVDGTPTSFTPNPNGAVYSISFTPSGGIGIFGAFTVISTRDTNGYGFYGAT
jgi:hypothetical protein